uniref:NADH dehydrogenase [ubiquinone] 1 alpha subcomplex subunit 11 n=1 Tax=Oncorhynchus tshawytscha TaxID=74940 RepID=A0AAZ3P6K8_ONCTS
MGYWDLQEGKDCVEKTWITTKLGTALGLVGSAYHIVAFQPDSAIQAVQRATNGTVTMAALGAIFGMTTCLAAQARDAPDDPVNYFIGGCASGVFLGARSDSQCNDRHDGMYWAGDTGHVHQGGQDGGLEISGTTEDVNSLRLYINMYIT